MESNIQYLHSNEIPLNPVLLETKPQTKRRKVVFLLRELFDYRSLSPEEKRDAINKAYQIVRENPQLLIDSMKVLERKLDMLRRKYLS